MENSRKFESVYSKKVRAGKRRTYFFDVRKTKGEDFYLTLTESTKKFQGNGYERHKIFLYKEDFNRFEDSLKETLDHIRTELMPDYDYEEYTRRHEEWEAKKAEMVASGEWEERGPRSRENDNDNENNHNQNNNSNDNDNDNDNNDKTNYAAPASDANDDDDIETEDDMAW
ncbi:MAG: hypothetical protein ACI9XO_002754 [Paraglaciecola sp.]